MSRRILSAGALLAPLAILIGCSGVDERLRESQRYYDARNYYQAWLIAEQLRAEHPDDVEIERHFWKARAAHLLEQGQQLVFDDHDRDALAMFEKVLALDPSNLIAHEWIAKAETKIANRSVRSGDDALASGDLEKALVQYNDALQFVPQHEDAIDGLKQVQAAWDERRQKAAQRYRSGVRALADQQFAQTDYQMYIALDHDPALDAARPPQEIARRRLAEQHLERARAREELGNFGAALVDYERVKKLQPRTEGIDAAIERMKREVEVVAAMQRAELAVLRGDFATGKELLEQAQQKTEAQGRAISDLQLLVREKEIEQQYERAQDREAERDLQGALDGYREIQAEWPDYQDVPARIASLESSVAEATKAYEAGLAAEQANDRAAAIDHFKTALLFYPRFKDAEARLAALVQ